MNFREILSDKNKFIILDGAMGTMLQSHGLLAGEYPEAYNFTHEDVVYQIHKAYVESGCNVILTNTFGANSLKISGIGHTVPEIVNRAVKIAQRAIQDSISPLKKSDIFIALDIGDLGQLMEPIGTLTFQKAYDLFKEIVIAGVHAGVDLIIFETMNDIYELKAAILAAKENSSLPILCSMNFLENGKTLTGTDPETMVYYLEGLGVDSVGMNCSLDPKSMSPIIKRILDVASVPVLIKPNAGLPQESNGSLGHNISAKEFAMEMQQIALLGAKILGGCCGTTPEFIQEISIALNQIRPVIKDQKKTIAVACSANKSVLFNKGIVIIGERINPTSRKAIKNALKEGNLGLLINEAVQQRDAHADILDVNVGIPDVNEIEVLQKVITEIQSVIDCPLQIDSSNHEAIDAAVRVYNGRPIINSVNGTEESMQRIFPLMVKYGAMAIALTLDERGLPKSMEDRVEITEKILKHAADYNIPADQFLFDCLVLTASVQQKEVMDTLNAIRVVKEKFGVKTTLGISNISFGLPRREILNSTYLAMALNVGLDAPICDPLAETNQHIIASFKVLTNQDIDAKDYIKHYKKVAEQSQPISPATPSIENLSNEELVLKGLKNELSSRITQFLTTQSPMQIIDTILIPSLEVVGQKYETNEIFLPQLIRSAETVKAGFELIKKALLNGKTSEAESPENPRNVVVLATVKGDIHDIGKNIIKVLLENYNFHVIDLGKDVPTEDIVNAVKKHDAKLVGLSALMTTTVANMKTTIEMLREQNLQCKVMVGGAVLNSAYAKMIGADYYGKNAWEAVNIAKRIYNK